MKENFEIIVGDLPFNPDYNELENAAKVVNANIIDLLKFILNSDIYKALDIFDCMNENRGCTTFDLCGFLTDLYNLLKKPVDKQSQDC